LNIFRFFVVVCCGAILLKEEAPLICICRLDAEH